MRIAALSTNVSSGKRESNARAERAASDRLHELELTCDAAEIPDQILIDLTGYEVGDTIHLSAVTLPNNVTSTIDDPEYTFATIVAPSALLSKDDEEEAAAAAAESAAAAEESAA